MTKKPINANKILNEAKNILAKEQNLSEEFKTTFSTVLTLYQRMMERLSLTSRNSSKSPSSDPMGNNSNTGDPSKKKPTTRKPGGQNGRKGSQLKPVEKPDEIKRLKLDKRTLPRGNYSQSSVDKRQVFELFIRLHVTEYQAEVWLDSHGNRYVAPFPKGVNRPAQYGPTIQAHSVYMSQSQLIPYQRVAHHFRDQAGISISEGSIHNFNQRAYKLLVHFEGIVRERLIASERLNADETGINVNKARFWLHVICNDKWSLFAPHAKRGHEAMEEMGVLPYFRGVLCHDHWKPYFIFTKCLHSLCNAHHDRELIWSIEQDKQLWASDFQTLLFKIKKETEEVGGKLSTGQQNHYRNLYQECLAKAELECQANTTPKKVGQRGRIKQSKSRNLLVRLRDYRDEVLRFTTAENIPFTNNQGENDIRMTKVKLKISGCFRSFEGAQIFCRIRSYLVTCRKHGVNPTEALTLLFQGKLPDFINSS